jgi:DNA-binding FadR family transcriptional regulator
MASNPPLRKLAVARPETPVPTLPGEASPGRVRTPKTAELVAATLRRMVVDGELKDGDFLPHEADLIAHFHVSRPTLREAVRVLESERLVEVRRGSRTGARVRVPGPEVVARPAGRLLALCGATRADGMTARVAIEPTAARLLAEDGTDEAHQAFRREVDQVPQAWEAGELAPASVRLHRLIVELSGNATLAVIAGMLHEISERHITAAIRPQQKTVPKAQYRRVFRSYCRLADLVAARDGDEAEAHWRRHKDIAGAALLKGYEKTKVRDIMD